MGRQAHQVHVVPANQGLGGPHRGNRRPARHAVPRLLKQIGDA
jgi:hypothetical protein